MNRGTPVANPGPVWPKFPFAPAVMLESLFVDSCFYPAERARSGPDE